MCVNNNVGPIRYSFIHHSFLTFMFYHHSAVCSCHFISDFLHLHSFLSSLCHFLLFISHCSSFISYHHHSFCSGGSACSFISAILCTSVSHFILYDACDHFSFHSGCSISTISLLSISFYHSTISFHSFPFHLSGVHWSCWVHWVLGHHHVSASFSLWVSRSRSRFTAGCLQVTIDALGSGLGAWLSTIDFWVLFLLLLCLPPIILHSIIHRLFNQYFYSNHQYQYQCVISIPANVNGQLNVKASAIND